MAQFIVSGYGRGNDWASVLIDKPTAADADLEFEQRYGLPPTQPARPLAPHTPVYGDAIGHGPAVLPAGVPNPIDFLLDQAKSFYNSVTGRGPYSEGDNMTPGIFPYEDDPYGIYGPDPGGDVLQSGVGVVAVGTMGLRLILQRAGPVVSRTILPAIRAAATRGVARWSALPQWLRVILISLGVTAGTDILIDTGQDDSGLIQWPGTTDLESIGSVAVVRSWTSNGVQMAKLADGRMAARRKDGSWTIWRPKKPIVIFAGGSNKLGTVLRADRALDRQAKKISNMLRRRDPRGKIRVCGNCGRNLASCRCK